MIRLETNRLIIRDPEPRDLDSWHGLMSDAETMYFLQDIMHHSIDETRQNLAEAIEQCARADREQYFFTIEKKDGEFVGEIGYTVEAATPVGKIAHLGYFIRRGHHGQGYTTEALTRLIEFAFAEDNVYRLKTGCFADNIASERVMQKCGLIKEGHYKKCEYHDGQMKDRLSYRLLRDEWVQSQFSVSR